MEHPTPFRVVDVHLSDGDEDRVQRTRPRSPTYGSAARFGEPSVCPFDLTIQRAGSRSPRRARRRRQKGRGLQPTHAADRRRLGLAASSVSNTSITKRWRSVVSRGKDGDSRPVPPGVWRYRTSVDVVRSPRTPRQAGEERPLWRGRPAASRRQTTERRCGVLAAATTSLSTTRCINSALATATRKPAPGLVRAMY